MNREHRNGFKSSERGRLEETVETINFADVSDELFAKCFIKTGVDLNLTHAGSIGKRKWRAQAPVW